ncbi:amidase [Photobacterium leiognathi]|uniref:amidase n=1 Tax=Photobacterium leiognathi TaxID=553611 RepID=UPI002739A518|nr:amidase [Photobacterium leiognathi]
MASFIITDNELFGATHNPWNLEYSTFSSSGGSACAIAAGVVPLAHGTDGAGSNRLPPSTTGLFGMKPSRYRMLSGEANGGHDLVKTNQAISRTVRDSAALFSMTEDKNNGHFASVGFVTTPLKRKLKVGVVRNIPNSTPIEPEVNKALESTIALLESLGHELVDVNYPVVYEVLKDSYQKIFLTKVGPLKALVEKVSGKSVTESGLLTHLLAQNIEQASGLSEEEIQQGVDTLNKLPAEFANMFKTCDVVLTPVAAFAGTKLNEGSYKDDWNDVTSNFILERLKYTAPVNFAGNPAMSVPLNWDKDNMPIGSQFIAPLGEDKLLYELAYQLEAARPWKDKWAPYSLMYPQNLS